LISLFYISSCGRTEADKIDESPIESPAYDFQLVSSKTQASLETLLQFSFQGKLPTDITNINWDFGDGVTFYGNYNTNNVYHSFKTLGNNTVKVKILYNNGKSVEKSIIVNITNNNQIKINKISITKVPQTSKPYYIFYGTYTVQDYFSGDWDQSYNRNTSDINRFADVYIELFKLRDIADISDPHNIITDSSELIYKSAIKTNQQNLIYDFSSSNLILNIESLKKLKIKIKDSEAGNSMLEDGGIDEEMRIDDILPNQFQALNQITINSNGWIYSIDYTKL
jgi:hypothetical protein